MEEEWVLDSGRNDTNSCTPIPAYHPIFITVLRVSVTLTAFLSILGSVLVIGTFVAFKSLRTKARQVLVQLSIADFAVAASQLVGVHVNLQKYAGQICAHNAQDDVNITGDTFCKIQGGLTIFFTVSSYFWTIAVGIYLFVVIVCETPRVGKWLTYLFYPLCWGTAATIVMTFGFLHAIGFHANVDTGWCYVQNVHKLHSITVSEVFSQVFVYLTYLTLLVLYIWIRCSIRCKLHKIANRASLSYKLQLQAKNVDFKLTFVPLIFIFLRIWGTILGIIHIYISSDFRETKLNAVFVLFSAIGSSAQGLTNALLFCIFTTTVRKRLLRVVRRRLCGLCCRSNEASAYLMEPSTNYSVSNRNDLEDHRDEEVGRSRNVITNTAHARCTPSVTCDAPHLFPESLENSKYHSISVGKRVTTGAE